MSRSSRIRSSIGLGLVAALIPMTLAAPATGANPFDIRSEPVDHVEAQKYEEIETVGILVHTPDGSVVCGTDYDQPVFMGCVGYGNERGGSNSIGLNFSKGERVRVSRDVSESAEKDYTLIEPAKKSSSNGSSRSQSPSARTKETGKYNFNGTIVESKNGKLHFENPTYGVRGAIDIDGVKFDNRNRSTGNSSTERSRSSDTRTRTTSSSTSTTWSTATSTPATRTTSSSNTTTSSSK